MPQEKVAEREVGVGVVGDRLGKVRAPRGDARRRVRGDRTKGVGAVSAVVVMGVRPVVVTGKGLWGRTLGCRRRVRPAGPAARV